MRHQQSTASQAAALYDPDAWRAANLLIDAHGPAAAIVVAQELLTELTLQRHTSARFWRLVVDVVQDWHRPFRREGETVQ